MGSLLFSWCVCKLSPPHSRGWQAGQGDTVVCAVLSVVRGVGMRAVCIAPGYIPIWGRQEGDMGICIQTLKLKKKKKKDRQLLFFFLKKKTCLCCVFFFFFYFFIILHFYFKLLIDCWLTVDSWTKSPGIWAGSSCWSSAVLPLQTEICFSARTAACVTSGSFSHPREGWVCGTGRSGSWKSRLSKEELLGNGGSMWAHKIALSWDFPG